MFRRIRLFAAALLAPVCLAGSASAAELYLNGTLTESLGRDDSSGKIEVLPVSVLGSDGDSSLGYGLGVGFGFGFDEVLPKKWDAWGTAFRIEGEFIYGRQWDFVSDTKNPAGQTLPFHFFDEVKVWTLMPANLYIDVPLRRPLSKIFGRVPRLEPFDFSFGFGAGISHVNINAFDNTAHARNTAYEFAFQANVALSYEVNERTKIQFGYRYLSLGATDANLLFDGTTTQAGSVNLALHSHELLVAARWTFHEKPLAEMKIPMPRWLGGGGDESETHKPEKPRKHRHWWPRWLGGKHSEP